MLEVQIGSRVGAHKNRANRLSYLGEDHRDPPLGWWSSYDEAALDSSARSGFRCGRPLTLKLLDSFSAG